MSSKNVSIVKEQLEKPNTTTLSPDSIQNTKQIKKNPSKFIEINMITKNRTVDNFYIDVNKKNFRYNKEKYTINEKYIYLLPLKSGFIMPTVYFKEGIKTCLKLDNKNKGITGKALSLLYDENLYNALFNPETGKYNFFIVILSIVSLIVFGIGLYIINVYFNGGV